MNPVVQRLTWSAIFVLMCSSPWLDPDDVAVWQFWLAYLLASLAKTIL